MRTVFKNVVSETFSPVDQNQVNEYLLKVSSWTPVLDEQRSDINNRNHHRGTSFKQLATAVKVAVKKGMIVASSFIWIDNNQRVSLLFNPSTEEWKLKLVKKERLRVEVSEEEYNNHLLEIKGQKQHDRQYGWFPKENPQDYYSIENWTF